MRVLSRVVLAALLVAALAVAWIWRDAPHNIYQSLAGERPLNKAHSWYYNLANIDVDKIARADADLLVIDYAKDGGHTPLTPEEVRRLKTAPDGRRRLVVAYMSIGEAEEFRFYWKPEWTYKPATGTAEPSATTTATNVSLPVPADPSRPVVPLVRPDTMPDWEVAANCAWPGAHAVRFWKQSWKNILFAGPDSYVKRIIAAGFDGVYLDRVDMFGILAARYPDASNARDDMIDFVTELATTARKIKPGFLVIPQNAEDLLSDINYRRVIDGLAKEELLFSSTSTGERNKRSIIEDSLGFISRLRWDWKPVFVVEYLTKAEQIDATRKEIKGLGLVPTFQPRSLDGGDPTAPRMALDIEHGTPEFIKKNCTQQNSW